MTNLRLSDLIVDSGARLIAGSGDVPITSLCSDSRSLRAGALFAALPGHKSDGRQYIADALAAGTNAVLAATGSLLPKDSKASLITADNPRLALARIAARFYGQQPQTMVAVTGTNGKSSTVTFCRQIWQTLGFKAASLGTLGIAAGGGGLAPLTRAGHLTTPDAIALHSDLADLAQMGVDHLAFEASSIGLDQYRQDGVVLRAAGFTNLSRDHLDYHHTMENYFAAKVRLFTEVLAPNGTAVVLTDTPYGERVATAAQQTGRRVLTLGQDSTHDIQLVARRAHGRGQYLRLAVLGQAYDVEFPLVGAFQALNALVALGLVISERPQDRAFVTEAVRALESVTSVRGRLELAATDSSGAVIYVDYAHTPDGLDTVLTALRPHTSGRLIVVFGCGGDRDPGKRPIMGQLAAKLADRVIVTDDNPRSENPDLIRQAIMAGCPTAENIGGRRQAIAAALKGLKAGDIVVVAGKGHEQGQIVGTQTLPFDDVTEVQQLLREHAA